MATGEDQAQPVVLQGTRGLDGFARRARVAFQLPAELILLALQSLPPSQGVYSLSSGGSGQPARGVSRDAVAPGAERNDIGLLEGVFGELKVAAVAD